MIIDPEKLEKTKEAFESFWKLENRTALVSVKAWADRQGFHDYLLRIKPDKRYSDPFHRKVDPVINIDYQINTFKNRYFAGETLPILSSYIGPGISSAFLGAVVDLGDPDSTTWFHENLSDWENYKVHFDPRNIWYGIQMNLTREVFRTASEMGCLAELPVDIYNGIDNLMLLRGSEKLATDLVLIPDTMKEATVKIRNYWDTWIEDFFQIAEDSGLGNGTGWLNLWGPGRTFTLQSDYMSLISTEMYEEFVLSDVRHMCSRLDHSMFHFDGPDEVVRHLPFLLDIQNLGGIQWNPKTNCENVRHLPVLKKIQESGKCLVLNISSHEIEPLLQELSPAGLLLNVDPFDEPCDTLEQADAIVDRIKHYSR